MIVMNIKHFLKNSSINSFQYLIKKNKDKGHTQNNTDTWENSGMNIS